MESATPSRAGRPIVTLTLNPSIDGACEAETVHPTRKVRTRHDRYDPGGGGINVARVVAELGGTAYPVYLAGGATGGVLTDLLARRGLSGRALPIADHTRISHAVYERSTGLEYRFVPEGPLVEPGELAACLEAAGECEAALLVASGSLPRGARDDTYATLARRAAERGVPFVLDSSGKGFAVAVEAGGIHLAKPSQGEFEALIGRPLREPGALETEALALVRSGRVHLLAVTLGHEGALLATPEGVTRVPALDVEAKSATGAGDSFVGGMVLALAQGKSAREAFLFGMAAGTAAVLTPGTELCRAADVARLHAVLLAREGSRAAP